MAGTLRFVLGDQLSRHLSSLADLAEGDVVFLCEVMEEATYVRHHKRKIAFLFSAMRHFAAGLEEDGVTVDYVRLDARGNRGDFTGELERAVKRFKAERVVVTEPGEWRVAEMMRGWEEELEIPVEIRLDDRFFCDHATFADWASGLKQLRMEYFYREMRRRTGYLMNGEGPEQSRWNFDKQNRKALPKDVEPPQRPAFEPDATTREVVDLVSKHFGEHFGDLDGFAYPVTRADALKALDWFVDHALPRFGDYQDAMKEGEPLLFHSNISALINCGLLTPREVCDRAEAAWRDGDAPINAVEGFIRQILGWREYVWATYRVKGRELRRRNALGARSTLPDAYWSGETDMACVADAVGAVRESAYAHHIQRLMVLGNLALGLGVQPGQVHDWFHATFIDAYEWVMVPNVYGMALYADGGEMMSKPYISTGRYVDRMSDHCDGCRFDPAQRTGEDACPLSTLYWDFLDRNAEQLGGNHRMGLQMRNLDKLDPGELDEIRSRARGLKQRLP